MPDPDEMANYACQVLAPDWRPQMAVGWAHHTWQPETTVSHGILGQWNNAIGAPTTIARTPPWRLRARAKAYPRPPPWIYGATNDDDTAEDKSSWEEDDLTDDAEDETDGENFIPLIPPLPPLAEDDDTAEDDGEIDGENSIPLIPKID